MANDSKVVRLSGQKPIDRFSLPTALVRLRDVSGQSLKGVLATFFDQADDSLFALADRAASNQDQTAYFDAMRELRLRRKSMTVSVLQYVSQAFNEMGRFKPGRSSSSLEEIDQEALSLVDHADLEQQVAIDNLTNRLRNRYQEPVRMLAARIRHLVPNLNLSDEQMPLSPEVLAGGISESCADLDIDIRAKLVVLKLFEKLLVDKLGDFYQDCNRALVAEGVLPEMKRAPVGQPKAPGRSTAVPPSAAPASSQGGFADAPHAHHASATFTELSALLHQGQGSAGVGETTAGGVIIDSGQLMSQLNQLQAAVRGAAQDEDQYQVVPLRQQLQPIFQATDGSRRSVAQVDSDVINLVSMLFDFILEDRQLHPVMKALIGRLQIPVLKVALNDRNFFNRGGHPVRKLLNELALAAIGWSEKRPGARDPLRDKIEQVVERVLTEFTDGVALFEELLADFGHFMDLDRRRRELVEQRLRDAEEGRARQEKAAQLATEVVEQEIAGHDLPEPVSQLLKEPWTRYLQWVALRQGEDSDNWQAACRLTRQLVWTVDPRPVSESTRTELLKAIPGVVEELRQGLQDISWDPFATDAAIRDLELAHVDVFQKLVTAPVEQPAPARVPEAKAKPAPAPVAKEEPVAKAEPELRSEPDSAGRAAEPVQNDPVEPAAAPAVSAEAADIPVAKAQPESTIDEPAAEVRAPAELWLGKADQLRVGSWVELCRDETRVRCKLAAFIKATGKYIFVNRSGAKVAEFHRDDLALAMQDGEITLLDDGLIFDRALESIIDNLRNSRRD
ncbi:MAG: DUF1631 domain-containing protein [Pseudomonadota bacterium]|nr:DUF1631 domain-containing protein [Pseudomonadota bacterium]